MKNLEMIKNICKAPGYESDLEFYLTVLRKVLKIGGKDLRALPLVKIVLESMSNQTEENILKALEVTKDKLENIDDEVLSPNYFVIVLKNQIDQNQKRKYITNERDVILQWGRSI